MADKDLDREARERAAAAALSPGAGSPLAPGAGRTGADWALNRLAASAADGMAAKLRADQEKAMGETVKQTLERVAAESSPITSSPETVKSGPGRSQGAEKTVSGHEQSGSTPFTVFDYLGLGFILEPPAVLVHAVMTGEHIDWSNGRYAIPFVLLGAVFIYIGRNWESIKARVNGRVVTVVDALSRSYIVPFIIFLSIIIGVAILPIWIWPPDRTVSPNVTQATPDEIAAAVVKRLPVGSQASGRASDTTTSAAERDRDRARADLQMMTSERDSLRKTNETLREQAGSPLSAFLKLTDAKRWQLTKQMQDVLRPTIPADEYCRAIVAQKPNSNGAVGFWTEFQPLLYYSGWAIEGGSQRTFFGDGITIKASADKGSAFTCAWRLSEFLQAIKIKPVNFLANQTTPDLLRCPKCIEVTIGDVEPVPLN